MTWQVIVNGELVPEPDATVHISDLGLRRGFAAFEFFRVVDGIPLFFEDHLTRLERSRSLIGVDGRWSTDELRGFVARVIDVNGLRDAGIQVVVTGGNSPDGFTPGDPALVVTPIAVRLPPAELYATGATVITHQNVRELADAKTTDYLIAVSLIPRMAERGAIEVLYHDGTHMLEGARSGLAIVTRDGVLVTAGRGVLESVTRKHLLQIAVEHMPVEQRDVTLEEFADAAEVILLGTTRGALPITRVDDRPVGSGAVGPHSERLQAGFIRHVEDYLAQRR